MLRPTPTQCAGLYHKGAACNTTRGQPDCGTMENGLKQLTKSTDNSDLTCITALIAASIIPRKLFPFPWWEGAG